MWVTLWDNGFSSLGKSHFEELKDSFLKETKREFTFPIDENDTEEFFKATCLRWCEQCGKIESVYDGGGFNKDGENYCSQCLEESYENDEEE